MLLDYGGERRTAQLLSLRPNTLENEVSHHFGFEKGRREHSESFVKGVQDKLYFWLWFGAQFSFAGSFLFYMKNILGIVNDAVLEYSDLITSTVFACMSPPI